ncbi:replicative DNA helicase [Helicobacter didelphidarum]|uniref:Replicative DNA helicase n=1 Tax=Helicobacter didelphidarum TaxID=2040648 RepID=A0A3D8IKJ7_9HELI|nr:replicative DNA helicase [Helicobacter didelphidarum]RDU65708.1 replicative DNA helicase [Helicobacter didelphidarum]
MENVIIQIERVVLSAILFSPDKFDEACNVLTHSDFILPLHACMFRACETMIKTNIPITVESLCMEMGKHMQVSLDDIAIIAAESPIANIDFYIKQIKNAAINRALFSLASFIRDESLKHGSSAKETLELVEKKIYSLSLQDYQSDFRDAKEIVLSTLHFIKENKAKEGALKGIDTGFKELNNATTGFNPGELIIVGARPSMGKTALALSMALKILSGDRGVALFSLEMPAEQLMLRMFAARSLIPLQILRSGDLDDNGLEKLTQCADELCSKSLYIDDNPDLTLAGLRSKLRKLKTKDDSVSIVMIDYLQLMSGVTNKGINARHEIIAEISRGLKNLARELNIPIVALSQLNRTLEARDDKRPILSDLRESGSIEQDADMILFLYRDEVYKERESKQEAKRKQKQGEAIQEEIYKAPAIEEAEIILAKNRNGETRTIKIKYNKKYTLFQDETEEREIKMSLQNAPTYTISDTIDISGMPL